jgi:hypothetical protein
MSFIKQVLQRTEIIAMGHAWEIIMSDIVHPKMANLWGRGRGHVEFSK